LAKNQFFCEKQSIGMHCQDKTNEKFKNLLICRKLCDQNNLPSNSALPVMFKNFFKKFLFSAKNSFP